MTTSLTPEYAKRTLAAKNETIALLNKELSYSQDLQKKDKIEFYNNHIAKLDNMLANDWKHLNLTNMDILVNTDLYPRNYLNVGDLVIETFSRHDIIAKVTNLLGSCYYFGTEEILVEIEYEYKGQTFKKEYPEYKLQKY